MTAEPAATASATRIECTLDGDPRLIAAVGAIAAHAAQRIGLTEREQEDLAAAALETCREALPAARKGDSHSTIRMSAVGFSDRVELIIETPGKGRATRKGAAGHKPIAAALVDRVEHETRGGRVYTTLVKYCAGASARRKS